MKRIMLTLILLMGIGGYTSYAQSELSLQECLKYALANNQQLARTRLEEDMGRFKTSEVRARALPQVNAQGQYTNNIKKQVLAVPGEITGGAPGTTTLLQAGTTHNVTASGTITQEVYNQSVFTGLRAAKAGEEYYKMQSAQSEETVIYNVTQLYYNTLVSREKMVVLDANIEKLTKLVETTSSQVQNGLARKIDLDRMRVNLTNYKTQRTQAQNQFLVQANQLKQQMGMPMSTTLSLPSASFKEIESKATVADFGGMNVDNRIEYRLLQKQEELQEFQKKAYKAEYYPSLALSGNYSYNGISNKFDMLKSKSNGSTASWYDMAAVSLTLKIPIFDGWARRSRVSQANVTLKQIRKDMEATTLSLNTQYENAKLQVQNNLATIKEQKENVDLANEVYNSTQNNYNLGLANLTDLLDAETSLTSAQNNYNEALLQYKLAELDIIKSNGNLKSLLN
ncbi:TolC family protein [Chitinophaga filiformis]|uniref:Outer membrane protein TolC n=1 Tax=Chitinophaga filiformis TaxID=104663 RepID=A0A1G7J491_CHIFI|nr:TolC family protein [Chitinophaga filiformis]SDF19750.1 Outer membrane protein TolC [Chitinophaga filiformis]